MMPSTALRTKYAADTDKMICLVLDVRGRASETHLLVWSYTKNKAVKLPYRYRNGAEITRIETPELTRWCAVSVRSWLATAEGLHGKPDLPPVMSELCRQNSYDMRTPRMIREEGERAIAEYVVSQQNKYRRLPGQRLHNLKGDRRNANIFA